MFRFLNTVDIPKFLTDKSEALARKGNIQIVDAGSTFVERRKRSVKVQDNLFNRQVRRERLEASLLSWNEKNSSFAVVYERGSRTFAVKREEGARALYQSLKNILDRINDKYEYKIACTCKGTENCGLIRVFWSIKIKNMVVVYRCGHTNPLRVIE